MDDVKIVGLRAENLLSLREVEVGFGKLTVFVGPNASGKSNIVRALQLLASHARHGLPSLPGYRGFREVAYLLDERAEVVVEVRALLRGAEASYRLALRYDDYREEAVVAGRPVLRSRGSEPEATVLARDGSLVTVVRGTLSSTPLVGRRPLYRSTLAELPSEAADELHLLARALRSVGAHSFHPDAIRARSGVGEHPVLGYRGERLARVLLHLYLEDRRRFSEIEAALQSLVPEVEEIVPHLEGTEVEIWLRVKGVPEPLRPGNISDGTLRLLAFVTALHLGSTLVAFEEPENCVHPHLLEAVVDLARKAPCQVVITTHSPHLLDHVEPEEVYVVEKRGPETVVKRLAESRELEAVRKLLEEGGTLGEAWYSGLVGGVPGEA